MTAPRDEGAARGGPRLRIRLFHWYFLLRRPMTFGVRAMILDEAARSVFLIRHTYVPGWQFPGGGVETGETCAQALEREVLEEAEIRLRGPAVLRSLHLNRRASPRDHVAFYVATDWELAGAKRPDREIAEARFFALDSLPDDLSPATGRRIREVMDGSAPSSHW